MQNLLDNLKNLLKKDERLVSDGELLKNKIIEMALKLDRDLIKLLLSDEKMKEVFFVDVDGTLVFDKDKFIKFVSNKQFLPDSYTAFKNKIGLVDEKGEFISEKKEVVLSWPYKDCVLEGGMTKEDQKRDEIFWNEILAPDEISRLLEPKVFTKAKRIDKNGEHPLLSLRGGDSRRSNPIFRTDENGNIKDNLIIKGNNLLVLHSLKKRFAGKVKLIFIDPPYNIGGKDFGYNDSFNESTWLTFMKNRLEAAYELLSSNGAIYVCIDHHENHALKMLLKEIFKDNFIQEIVVKTADPAGFKVVNPGPVEVTEYIYAFAKRKDEYIRTEKELFVEDEDVVYPYIILNKNEKPENWKIGLIKNEALKSLGVETKSDLIKKFGKRLSEIILKKTMELICIERADSVFTTYKPDKPSPSLKKVVEASKKEPKRIFVYKKTDGNFHYLLNGRILAFYSSKLKKIDGEIKPVRHLTNLWTDISWSAVDKEGGVILSRGKKPEKLIKRVIELCTNPGDLVLDFFMGTGTTCAVAHKMGRQYIGVEQLDYGENSAVVRLKNVINGDQTGISKAVGWQGGGDFVYLEIMKWNENFVEKIQKAKTKEELKKLWKTMKEKAFLSYKVDIKTIDEHAKDFDELSIDDQKRFLLECLDKNHLYVNYSEIDDEEYGVSEEDKRLNKEFYES